MKILVFTAAASVAQTLAVTSLLKGLRGEGHTASERSLPHFRLEKEPADALVVMLNDAQAKAYTLQLTELEQVFGSEGRPFNDIVTEIHLPDTDEELVDFDFDNIVEKFKGEDVAGQISIEQAKAEAIERGLAVTESTTREELERMLDMTISPATQAAERADDERNNLRKPGDERVGLRTSGILPTVNGVDFGRMNDDQLRAAAAGAGLSVSTNMKRETIINKLVQLNAQQAGVQTAPVKANEGQTDNADLEGKSNDDLKAIAAEEEIDLGSATRKDDLIKAIASARAAKAGTEQ